MQNKRKENFTFFLLYSDKKKKENPNALFVDMARNNRNNLVGDRSDCYFDIATERKRHLIENWYFYIDRKIAASGSE